MHIPLALSCLYRVKYIESVSIVYMHIRSFSRIDELDPMYFTIYTSIDY